MQRAEGEEGGEEEEEEEQVQVQDQDQDQEQGAAAPPTGQDQIGPEPEQEQEPGPEQGPEQQPGPGPELGPEPEQEPGPGPEQGPEQQPGPGPGPELGPETGQEPGPGPALGPETGPEPGPGPGPGPGAVAEEQSPQLHPDRSDAGGGSEQENKAQTQLTPHRADLNVADSMGDQEAPPPDEEDDFIVLHADHPLVRRQQVALNLHLSRLLERINVSLKDKAVLEKAEAKQVQETGVEMFRVQEQLGRLQNILDECNQAKAQAEAKHQQAGDQLEVTKFHFSNLTTRDSSAKASVSQLQAELDNLMLHLVITQADVEDMESHVKVMGNVKLKAGTQRKKAEEQKLKQDFYVDHLTRDMDRLMQEIAMYEVQTSAQAGETQEAKAALTEPEMDLEALVLTRKHLLQQWSSALLRNAKQDETLSAMQEAVRSVNDQVNLQDREIRSYKKSTTEEQEKNEVLTMQLNRGRMDCETIRKWISQKQAQEEALKAHYSTLFRALQETERTLSGLSKEMSTHETEVSHQRRWLQNESIVRLELEDEVMTHMQQGLTFNRTAKYTQRLSNKKTALKKEKISQLWQLENDMVMVVLESCNVGQNLDNLVQTQEALDQEVARYNNLVTSHQAKTTTYNTLIRQKQHTITNNNKKIHQIKLITGSEELSPFQIKILAISGQIEEKEKNIKRLQQLWMKQQGTLVGLNQEKGTNSKHTLKLQTEYTSMVQKKMRFEAQIEAEHREDSELEKNVKTQRGDLLKLNTQLSQKGQMSLSLEQENALMKTDFLRQLKELEQESIQMQMKVEKTQEEKDRLLNSLLEAERQIMLWDKKTQLVKQIRSVIDSEVGQAELQMMRAEINYMEGRLSQLMRQRERLLRESEATVARRETIVLRQEAMALNSNRQTSKGELERARQTLRRKIYETRKHVEECEMMLKGLKERQETVGGWLAQEKQRLAETCGASFVLNTKSENLQDNKEGNLAYLVALQSRAKRLQALCQGRYKPSSTSESVGAALQSQVDRVRTVSTILHRVREEFPQYQATLRRLSLAVGEAIQVLQ